MPDLDRRRRAARAAGHADRRAHGRAADRPAHAPGARADRPTQPEPGSGRERRHRPGGRRCCCCSATRSSSAPSSPWSRPAAPRSSRGPRRAPGWPAPRCAPWRTCRWSSGSTSSASRSARWSSARSASPRSRTCSSRCSRRVHVPESLLHPIVVRGRPRDRGLPARRAGRDDPQEHRAGRPRPGRAGARARRSGAS